MDVRQIHLYSDASGQVDFDKLAKEVAGIFPACSIDIRQPFLEHWSASPEIIQQSAISDTKTPFEKQPKERAGPYGVQLVDGFVMQRILAQIIPEKESSFEHLHVMFTDLLICTFDEEDWRYHGRAVICGTPSIISTTGIVEAPAKPKEFYLAQLGGLDIQSLKRRFAGRFIDYNDARMTCAAAGYALQAIFFFITGGQAFCKNSQCRLFNAHWQEDLIRTQIENPALCLKHQRIANKFNRRLLHAKRS